MLNVLNINVDKNNHISIVYQIKNLNRSTIALANMLIRITVAPLNTCNKATNYLTNKLNRVTVAFTNMFNRALTKT